MRNPQFSPYSSKAIHRWRRLPVYGLNRRHEGRMSSRAEIAAAGGARDRLLHVGQEYRRRPPSAIDFSRILLYS